MHLTELTPLALMLAQGIQPVREGFPLRVQVKRAVELHLEIHPLTLVPIVRFGIHPNQEGAQP